MTRQLAMVSAFSLMTGLAGGAIEPRKSLQDYPLHGESTMVDIGAEYQVHGFSADGRMYFTKDYLVCEVGLYPKGVMELKGDSFELRINHAKTPLPEAGAEFVAASLQYPDWTQHPQLEVGAGAGDAGVVLGRPNPVGRFPGDPSIGRPQKQVERPDIERPAADPAKLAIDTALATGRVDKPVAGNVYFAWSGNVKKIRNLSLILHTSAGDLEIPIR